MKLTKNQLIVSLVFVLVIATSFFTGQYFGKQSSVLQTTTSRSTIDELFPLRNCLDEYTNAIRAWDCSWGVRHDHKRCAISLLVENDVNKSGKAFLDGLTIHAQYEVNGLIQSWIFDNGDSFDLEANGSGYYRQHGDGNNTLLTHSYNCSRVEL